MKTFSVPSSLDNLGVKPRHDVDGRGVNKSPVLSSVELSRAVDRMSLQTFQAITVSHVRCSKLRLSYSLLSEKIHVIRSLTNSGVEMT